MSVKLLKVKLRRHSHGNRSQNSTSPKCIGRFLYYEPCKASLPPLPHVRSPFKSTTVKGGPRPRRLVYVAHPLLLSMKVWLRPKQKLSYERKTCPLVTTQTLTRHFVHETGPLRNLAEVSKHTYHVVSHQSQIKIATTRCLTEC